MSCGTALPGLLCAKLGAKVILTDMKDEKIINNIQITCKLNNLEQNVQIVPLNWGRFDKQIISLDPDLVISADCFYNSKGIFRSVC